MSDLGVTHSTVIVGGNTQSSVTGITNGTTTLTNNVKIVGDGTTANTNYNSTNNQVTISAIRPPVVSSLQGGIGDMTLQGVNGIVVDRITDTIIQVGNNGVASLRAGYGISIDSTTSPSNPEIKNTGIYSITSGGQTVSAKHYSILAGNGINITANAGNPFSGGITISTLAGSGVSTLNNLTGAVTITAGNNITITQLNNNILISSGGGGGVSTLNSLSGAINLTSSDGTIIFENNGTSIDMVTYYPVQLKYPAVPLLQPLTDNGTYTVANPQYSNTQGNLCKLLRTYYYDTPLVNPNDAYIMTWSIPVELGNYTASIAQLQLQLYLVASAGGNLLLPAVTKTFSSGVSTQTFDLPIDLTQYSISNLTQIFVYAKIPAATSGSNYPINLKQSSLIDTSINYVT